MNRATRRGDWCGIALALTMGIGALNGCALGKVQVEQVGSKHESVPVESVRVFLEETAVPMGYSYRGWVRRSSLVEWQDIHQWVFAGELAKHQGVIESLKEEAAKLGANGILLCGHGRPCASWQEVDPVWQGRYGSAMSDAVDSFLDRGPRIQMRLEVLAIRWEGSEGESER